MLYSCPNFSAIQHLVHLNVGTPTPMRGPGSTPALFALESAMDELAIKLNMDPLELRLKNYAEIDEAPNLRGPANIFARPIKQGRNNSVGASAIRKLARCAMAMKFWAGAWPRALGRRRGTQPKFVSDCWQTELLARPALRRISAPALTPSSLEVVSDKTGMPLDKIQVVLGDSALPPGPISGGSSATATVLPGYR